MDDRNAWRDAWQALDTSASAVPVTVVRGDQLDQNALSVEEAYVGDVTALSRLNDRYHAPTIIVAIAEGTDGGPLSISGLRYDTQTGARTDIARMTVDDPKQLPEAVKKMHDQIEQAWRSVATVRRDSPASLDAVVPIRGLGDWVQVRQRLGAIPAIKGVVVKSSGSRSRQHPSRTISARPTSSSRRLPRPACSSTRKPTNGDCSRGDTTAPINRWRFWLGAAALFILALWLLNEILLPFVVGGAVAYFFDPVVARLERYGLIADPGDGHGHHPCGADCDWRATAIVPPLFGQIEELVARAPMYIVRRPARVQPMIEPIRARLGLPPSA